MSQTLLPSTWLQQQSPQIHCSHNGQLGQTLPCGQGAPSLVSGSYPRWILSTFYSFLKTKQDSLHPTKTSDTHVHLLHPQVRKLDISWWTCHQIPVPDCCLPTLVARLPLSAAECDFHLEIYWVFTALQKHTAEMQWLFLSHWKDCMHFPAWDHLLWGPI